MEYFIRIEIYFYKSYLIKRNVLYNINSSDKSINRSSYDDDIHNYFNILMDI